MGTFNRDRRSGGSRDFGKRSFDNDRNTMHKAVCNRCGKDCEVPFKPTGSKPVLCRDCFRTDGGSSSDSRRFESRSSGRSSYEDRPMYDAVCASCGKNCKIPFEPRTDKPVYCSDCFEKNGGDSRRSDNRNSGRSNFESRDRNTEQINYKEQFDALNVKIDKILHLLAASEPLETKLDEKIIEEIVEEVEDEEPKKEKVVAKKKTKTTKKATPAKKE